MFLRVRIKTAANNACKAMRPLIFILLFTLQHPTFGQFKVKNPKPIVYHDNIDSFRVNFSNFCLGQSILKSEISTDIRIYRFQAFGDMKLIRIYNINKHTLGIDIYSSLPYKDSLLFHKTFRTVSLDKAIRVLFKKLDPLNLPTLDYDYVSSRQMPSVNYGNWYTVEAKVGNIFSYQEFNNPEVYALHYSDKLIQAKPFTEFVKGVEKLTGIKIIDAEIPRRQ